MIGKHAKKRKYTGLMISLALSMLWTVFLFWSDGKKIGIPNSIAPSMPDVQVQETLLTPVHGENSPEILLPEEKFGEEQLLEEVGPEGGTKECEGKKDAGSSSKKGSGESSKSKKKKIGSGSTERENSGKPRKSFGPPAKELPVVRPVPY